MKTPREINDLIDARNELHSIIKEKLEVIDSLSTSVWDDWAVNDPIEYLTINIKDGFVVFEKEQRNDYPYTFVNFPIKWLSMDNEEIKNALLLEKDKKEEQERQAEIERNRIEYLRREEEERKEFERLKAKFLETEIFDNRNTSFY